MGLSLVFFIRQNDMLVLGLRNILKNKACWFQVLGPIFFRNVDSPKLTVVSFYEVHSFHFQNGVKFKFLRLLIQTFWQEICFQVLSLFKRTYFSSHTLCDLIALQISKDSRNELVSSFHGEQTQRSVESEKTQFTL